MEIYKIEDLSFNYNGEESKVLKNINLSIKKGEFITIFGKSGSGKSTFLRHLKPQITPFGKMNGKIFFNGNEINLIPEREIIQKIGFVFQDPEVQCITDKVWHELAFGLESLGTDSKLIKLKIAEISDFFHMNEWFYKDVEELSGGQKQLLNLASVIVMNPEVIILDEPTSQISPIMASEFLNVLKKINKEFGTTVILSEHRLSEVIEFSDRFFVMEEGSIVAEGTPQKVCIDLYKNKSNLFNLLPEVTRMSLLITSGNRVAANIIEGKEVISSQNKKTIVLENLSISKQENIVELKNIWFKYKDEDILKDLSLKIIKGSINTIVGQNGSGKTTLLLLLSGIIKQYRGKAEKNYRKVCILPQNIKTLFTKETIEEDLMEVFNTADKEMFNYAVKLFEIESLLKRHPFDLSGGEQQRACLAKLFLHNPDIVLLDEPTKGMDGIFKNTFNDELKKLKSNGITVVMVTHDIEFASKCSDYISLMFNGEIIITNNTREFLSGNLFYTTVANRIARDIDKNIIKIEEIVELCKE